jgi:hypothetical protein
MVLACWVGGMIAFTISNVPRRQTQASTCSLRGISRALPKEGQHMALEYVQCHEQAEGLSRELALNY